MFFIFGIKVAAICQDLALWNSTDGEQRNPLIAIVASDAAPIRVKRWRAIDEKQILVMTVIQFQAGRPAAIGRAPHWSGLPAIEITYEAYGLRAWGIAEKSHVMLLPPG